MKLFFESDLKLECPFTSAEVVRRISATVSTNAIHLLKTSNLQLKFPDVTIDEGNQLFVINGSIPECQEFTIMFYQSGK